MTTPIVTLAMTLAFCAIHLFIGRLRWLDRKPRSRWLSFAGGVAVGYVFLHILPELGLHAMHVEDVTDLGDTVARRWVYTLALSGLALFYGLERLLTVSRLRVGNSDGGPDQTTAHCWLHIGAQSILIVTITYMLNSRDDISSSGLALYFAAMALHLMSADFGMRLGDPEHYDRYGRWVLVAATLCGWGFGLTIELPEMLVICLFAFIGGAIMLLALKEELPEDRESAFLPFLIGMTSFAALVLGEAYLGVG